MRAQGRDGKSVTLKSTTAGAKALANGVLVIPTPAVEVGMDYGADAALPLPGARTAMMKVLRQEAGPRSLTLLLEAQNNSTQTLFLRQRDRRARLNVEGGTVTSEGKLEVHFPAGEGYVRQSGDAALVRRETGCRRGCRSGSDAILTQLSRSSIRPGRHLAPAWSESGGRNGIPNGRVNSTSSARPARELAR